MTRPPSKHPNHARGRFRDRCERSDRRNDRPLCAVSGKRVFVMEADVLLAFRSASVPARPYLCPHCGGWHGTSLGAA